MIPQLFWIPAIAVAAVGVLICAVLGVAYPETGFHLVVFASVLGILALLFAAGLFRSLELGDIPGVERDWGGLGGDAGGWRMSLSLVYLTGTCLFAVLAASILFLPHPNHKGSGPHPLAGVNQPAGSGSTSSKAPGPGTASQPAPVAPPTGPPAPKAPGGQ